MKASGSIGDKAVEGNGENGHNGCIRRLTIEPLLVYADQVLAAIFTSLKSAPQANSIPNHKAS